MQKFQASLSAIETFGDLLKFLRRRARLTQRELSVLVGYSEAQISRLESNLRPPDPTALKALFVPALGIADEPETITRLLELAASSTHQLIGDTPPEQTADETSMPRAAAAVDAHQRRPNNLPVQLTSFIGREQELKEVCHLLATSRLITLHGSGGTGKTRLSLQIAANRLDAYADGVWLVELAPLADPDLVPQAVATALDFKKTGEMSYQEILNYGLQKKHLLLVLDNCEHLLDACARLAVDLLQHCPTSPSWQPAVRYWASPAKWPTACHPWKCTTLTTSLTRKN